VKSIETTSSGVARQNGARGENPSAAPGAKTQARRPLALNFPIFDPSTFLF